MGQDDAGIGELNMELVREEEQRGQWRDENERRRHNYVPFCIELIRALAASGNMPECTKKAKEKMKTAHKKRSF